MNPSWLVILALTGILSVLDAAVLISTYLIKRSSRRAFRVRMRMEEIIRDSIVAGSLQNLSSVSPEERMDYFLAWTRIGKSVLVPDSLLPELGKLEKEWGLERNIRSFLGSRSFKKRVLGIDLLILFHPDPELIRRVLKEEKSMMLKLKIIKYLCEADTDYSIDSIRLSMEQSGENYKIWVLRMLRDNHDLLNGWAEKNRESTNRNTRRILIQATRSRLEDWYYPFLRRIAGSREEQLAKEAAGVLMESYGDRDVLEELMESPYPEVRGMAVYHYFRSAELPDREHTAHMFGRDEFFQPAVRGLAERVGETPRLLPVLFSRYLEGESEGERRGYASVLASRISYFILRLKEDGKKDIARLLDDIIGLGFSSPLINFLNVNRNLSLENELVKLILPHAQGNPDFRTQCRLYLNDKLKARLALPPAKEAGSRAKIQLTGRDRRIMFLLMSFALALPIGIFFLAEGKHLPLMTGEEIFVSFLFLYHGIFAFYTLSLSTFYLFLMMQSWINIRHQQDEWEAADDNFLNTPGLMPSVSILAPAYNEETTIVQNVYSLLSLNYPSLEILVINDGSGDRTLERLIEQFDLNLADSSHSGKIGTAPVKGVYRTERIPNLTVIDKENGGKADALNVGLNIAGGEYVCSIDADSLLEPDSLMKLMFRLFHSGKKTVAIGGNIIPVNGCLTREGAIREIHLPRNKYSRYQTIEYLRSFIAGRIGWARMKGLMIISGAFGAFSRREVLDIGGYMTGTGSLARDTVGEDMELVVRLIKRMEKTGKEFRIDYSHNANCWTEVPERLGDLLKQRDRWQRGLIEILLYHKDMIFNKKYGVPGLLTLPYLFLFEILGPFWEFLGYIVLSLSLVFGLLSGQVFLFMFSIIVLLGILISSLSLFLAERDVLYFQGRDFTMGILTAILENFGFRQLVSMHRAYVFAAYLIRDKGWQKLARRGFTQATDGKAD